ncbi:MAG: hypothetical protein ACD_4C00086G0011 [uncultured bacterium (gcode 4)]|uniref:Uncharacterized protein n=1 Tax=uncultured bacterium (gcode 4) TaxID=1234023 RepID=K2GUL7_9BACT|nr:MAG: hypothetical protein ACD_4C00086G0011 [uncultured bacterium (gcode 4)]
MANWLESKVLNDKVFKKQPNIREATFRSEAERLLWLFWKKVTELTHHVLTPEDRKNIDLKLLSIKSRIKSIEKKHKSLLIAEMKWIKSEIDTRLEDKQKRNIQQILAWIHYPQNYIDEEKRVA